MKSRRPVSVSARSVLTSHGNRSPPYNERMREDDLRPFSPSVMLTHQDYLLLPDDGKRHELIDGGHFVAPAPNRKHQAIAMNLTAAVEDL